MYYNQRAFVLSLKYELYHGQCWLF